MGNKMITKQILIAVACACVVSACSGGDEAGAVEKCDRFVDTLCDRIVSCIGNITHGECVQVSQQEVGCGAALEVSESYDRCIDQFSTFSCSILFPVDPITGQPETELPADCVGVLLF